MSRITEKRDVQDQLINYLTGIGWTFIEPCWLLYSSAVVFGHAARR